MYAGDVIKFAGDAILVLFTNDDETSGIGMRLRDSLYKAALCALDLQRDVSVFEATEDILLRLKVMLAYGDTNGFFVGDQDRFEFLVDGHALDQISVLDKEANPGEGRFSPFTRSL